MTEGRRSPIHNAIIAAFHVEISLGGEIVEILRRGLLQAGPDPSLHLASRLGRPFALVLRDQWVIAQVLADEVQYWFIVGLGILIVIPFAVVGEFIGHFLGLELRSG